MSIQEQIEALTQQNEMQKKNAEDLIKSINEDLNDIHQELLSLRGFPISMERN